MHLIDGDSFTMDLTELPKGEPAMTYQGQEWFVSADKLYCLTPSLYCDLQVPHKLGLFRLICWWLKTRGN